MLLVRRLLLAVAVAMTAACATYTTPAGGVDFAALAPTDSDIAAIMAREPAARFPANIALVRAQATDYSRFHNACYGKGAYCVITARDVEHEADLDRLARLPMIAGVAPLNRIVVPNKLESVEDLRAAAAQLRADLLLVYSFDTRFFVDARDLGPLATVSLGLIPNRKATVTTTASLGIYDVRTGFLYGLAEATASNDQRATLWSTEQAIERARQRTEQQSLASLVDEFEVLWKSVVESHTVARPAASVSIAPN